MSKIQSGNLAATISVVAGLTATINSNTAEVAEWKKADKTLQANIDAEVAERKKADETLQSNIDAEASARKSADKTLQARTAIHLAYVDGDLALVEE